MKGSLERAMKHVIHTSFVVAHLLERAPIIWLWCPFLIKLSFMWKHENVTCPILLRYVRKGQMKVVTFPQRNERDDYPFLRLLRKRSGELIFLGYEIQTYKILINTSILRLTRESNSLHKKTRYKASYVLVWACSNLTSTLIMKFWMKKKFQIVHFIVLKKVK